MTYTTQQEHLILSLIKYRRKQLQEDRESLKKAGELSDRNKNMIAAELEELRLLEIKNREVRIY